MLATPRLVALCEEASCLAIEGHLPDNCTSVAKRLQFDHLVPVGVGGTVWAEATLDRIEGRRLVFTLSVSESAGLVAAGKLIRVIVDRDDVPVQRALSEPTTGATGRPRRSEILADHPSEHSADAGVGRRVVVAVRR